MQIGICIQDPTTATGGPPPELVALQAILEQLNQINGNTDLVESLQEAGNTALTNITTYVDGLESLITSLNSQTDGLEAMMASLGINTDGIEGQLTGLAALSTTSNYQTKYSYAQGWALSEGVAYPALVRFNLEPAAIVAVTTYTIGSIDGQELFTYGTSWGVGPIPAATIVNTPGSFGITGVAVTSMPVASVKSFTLAVTNNAVDYSTNAGTTWVTIAAGTRTWAAQAGASLDVTSVRFRGTLATAMYDVIYEE